MARSLITPKGKQSRIEGMAELNTKIEAILSRTVGGEIKKVYMGGALILRDRARALAPERTGRLKSAIFAAYGEGDKPNVLVGVNYKIAGYAHIVEFGGSDQPAQPYMRPALRQVRNDVVAKIATGLRQLLVDFS